MATAGDGDAVVRFDDVSLRYGPGPEVLQDVSFALADGAFYFLTGPSGAGKTSLLRMMYLAIRPTHGTVTIFGQDIARTRRSRLPELRRRIGVVFQDFRLLGHLSAFDNVALPLRIAGRREDDVRRQVVELLAWIGLESHLQARPSTLSGGQQQLVAIARAIVGRPRLLLADEPTGNVDDSMAIRLMHLFGELNRLGVTVVVATHSRSLAERFGHGHFRVENGRFSVVTSPATPIGGAGRSDPDDPAAMVPEGPS